jgi:putative peptide zinc metalloprotease protein
LLASLAALLWCCSRPGLVHSLSFNVMVVCSVSTLLLNGNPLLRYDGYHVLADLWEVPNLAEQSRAVLVRAAALAFLGAGGTIDRTLPIKGRWLLGLYGVASLAYRCFITLAILWFVHRITKSYGMEVLGNALAVVVLGGMVLLPAWRFAAFLGSRGTRWGTQYLGSGSWRRGRRWGTQYPGSRAIVLCGLWAGGLVFFALLPWPCRVAAPMVVEPENAHRVYAVVAGTMISSVRAGERVEKGQEVARLVNLDIRKEIVELTGKRNQQRRQLAILRQRQRDEESLVLRAPLDGTVLPPGHHVPMVDSVVPPPASAQLGTWTGTPLDERNRGCQVETGTLVCMIGSAQPVEAFTVIDQDAVALVREGQPVRLRIDALPGEVFEGRVVEIATSDLKVVPRELAAGADLAVRVDPRGIARPASISYQVRVRFDRQPGVSLLGSRGQAKILVEPQSLVERLYRAFRQTFELRW